MTDRANVLVVDDEPELRELLADALTAGGLTVTAAPSGRAAIEEASRTRPDFLVTDLRLGDCTGLDVIDTLRRDGREIPTVVITGYGDGPSLLEVSRRHVVDLMTKPLDLAQLTATIRGELARRQSQERQQTRTRRLRTLARQINRQRKAAQRELATTCADLSAAYRNLSDQMALAKTAAAFQNELIAARSDDDVFRDLFRLFVTQSGGVFGVAMVCDANAELRVAGRFGVPVPDSLTFCQAIARPLVDMMLVRPECVLIDAGDEAEKFPAAIRRKLPGVSVLAIPLVPAQHELIGLVVLYRKGEQPFTDADVTLAREIGHPTALAVRRND